MKKSRALGLEPYLFILPLAALLFGVLGTPIVNLFKFSFGDSNVIQGYMGWNNFENYKYLPTDEFRSTLIITIVWVVFGVFGVVFVGMSVSLALNKPFRGQSFVRALVIVPWVVPHAFAGVMWTWVLHPQFGILNELLLRLGLTDAPISFLGPDTALAMVIIVRIWQGTPFMIITMTAALSTVSEELLEAAELDGAGAIRRFIHVTLPSIRPVLAISILMITAWTLQIFDSVFVMTNGGPGRATRIIALDIYNKVFIENDLGGGAAIAVVTLLVVTLIGWVALKKQEQNDG
ncbi:MULTISPECIES: carbohydrate ABC transporter permease [Actinomyces]|uniref:Sugar ABC transporter permease n=1 Tax=Actinomyces respiraculi TaxID=2744574 RepID=A0A7T0PXJ1_9ACTO|nr:MULTISPECIES: sugar ABC transporter permease [Actinomyces]QPL05900.1 sugar ABC transporter permease [Actinomyces respiraculi]